MFPSIEAPWGNSRQFFLTAAWAAILLFVPQAQAQQSQDWALRACKNEAGARIADLPLSEISVETSTSDGDGNAVINWRTTRGSSGFCRVSRQGNILQFKVEEMAKPAGPGQPDSDETRLMNTCRNEAASRLGIPETSVFVHVSTRDANETEMDWRTRRGSTGVCTVDRRGRIASFEIYRRNEGTTPGTGGGGQQDISYAQRTAYDSGYSWGQDDDRRGRTRDYQRYRDLYTAETQSMFRKGYEDGFDRRQKDYGTGNPSGPAGTPVPAGIQPGRYAIQFSVSGRVLDLRTEDGTTVQQWSGSLLMNKKNQLWDIEDARNGYFYIRSALNGKALTALGTANGSGVEAQTLGNRREQQWRIKVMENGEVLILSRLGPALDLPEGDRGNGAKPHLWQEHGRDNQRFKLSPSS